jgi:hypothetical protein
MTFWRWMIRGHPGYRAVLNGWLLIHCLVGLALAAWVELPLSTSAMSVLLPVGAIFVGMAFAWTGSSHALLQTAEVASVAAKFKGGFTAYVMTFQLATFVILFTLSIWTFAALQVFDVRWPTADRPVAYFVIETVLYAVASLAVRECWHVIGATQQMLLAWHIVRQAKDKDGSKSQTPSDTV